MQPIPATGAPDDTAALLAGGYRFMPRRFIGLGTDAFRTRLMLSPANCVRGSGFVITGVRRRP